MGSLSHFLRGFPLPPHRRFDLAPNPQSSQWGTRSGSNPLLCILVSPANATGPSCLVGGSQGTWVSVVIDICGTSKESQSQSLWEGLSGLARGWVRPSSDPSPIALGLDRWDPRRGAATATSQKNRR